MAKNPFGFLLLAFNTFLDSWHIFLRTRSAFCSEGSEIISQSSVSFRFKACNIGASLLLVLHLNSSLIDLRALLVLNTEQVELNSD